MNKSIIFTLTAIMFFASHTAHTMLTRRTMLPAVQMVSRGMLGQASLRPAIARAVSDSAAKKSGYNRHIIASALLLGGASLSYADCAWEDRVTGDIVRESRKKEKTKETEEDIKARERMQKEIARGKELILKVTCGDVASVKKLIADNCCFHEATYACALCIAVERCDREMALVLLVAGAELRDCIDSFKVMFGIKKEYGCPKDVEKK